MAYVIQQVLKHLPKTKDDTDLDLDTPFNTMVDHFYFDRLRIGAIPQCGMHSDCLYDEGDTKDGQKQFTFSEQKNSQKEHTVVATLSLGDPRILEFSEQEFCTKAQMKKGWKASHPHLTVGDKIESFPLTNGSLMVLHPSDEEPKVRRLEKPKQYTFFMHGILEFGGDPNVMSIGQMYRVCTKSRVFSRKSELLKVSDKQIEQCKERDYLLEEHMSDKKDIAKKHALLFGLFIKISQRYRFNKR